MRSKFPSIMVVAMVCLSVIIFRPGVAATAVSVAAVPEAAASSAAGSLACPGQSVNNSPVALAGFSPVNGVIPRPVILVHGWDSDYHALAGLATRIQTSPVVHQPVKTFLFDYGANGGHWAAIPAIASCLADYIHTLSKAYKTLGGDGKVILIGHSMGGLAIRFATDSVYAAHPAGADVLAGVITIDTPHLGSPWGGTPPAKLIQLSVQTWHGHGPEGLFPSPNGDAQLCLTEHHGAFQNIDANNIGQLCATPSWIPAGVPIAEIAGDITVHRDIFGFQLYARDTQGDAIVTRDSSSGYLPDSGTGAAPIGTDKPTIFIDRCDITEGQLQSNIVSSTLSAFGSGLESVFSFGDQPLTSPGMDVLAAAAVTANCSHIHIYEPDRDPFALLDVIAAINADADKLGEAATQIEQVTPFLADGRIRLPLAPDTGSGYQLDACDPSPAANVAGVYRCGSTADYLPACWPDPAKSLDLFCMHTPGDETVVRTTLPDGTAPAPANTAAVPWEIVLDDRTVCTIRIGGSWPMPPAGYGYSYECGGDKEQALVGSLVTGSTVNTDFAHWTAHAVHEAVDNPPVVEVGVQKVIYAGAAPTVAPAQTGVACPSAGDLQRTLPAAQRIDPASSGGIHCANGWALTSIDFTGNAGQALFRQSGDTWRLLNLNGLCTLPSAIPAPLYQGSCRVN